MDDKERIRQLEEKVEQLLRAQGIDQKTPEPSNVTKPEYQSQSPLLKNYQPPSSSPAPPPTAMDKMAADIRTMKNRQTLDIVVKGIPGLFVIWFIYSVFFKN